MWDAEQKDLGILEGPQHELWKIVSELWSETVHRAGIGPGQRLILECVSGCSMPQPGTDGLSCCALVLRATPSPCIPGVAGSR